MVEFDDDFDREKSEWTKQSRGIDFASAREVFRDPVVVVGPGQTVDGEERWLRVGKVNGVLWTVGYTIRNGKIRIFSVRPPRDYEKEAYNA